MPAARDRDAAGRPRNARPRDGLGRPLQRAAEGEPTMAEDLRLTDRETVELAQALLDDGRPFHAHEVLEARWKSSEDARQRRLWQALAQLAVGLTHQARGNRTGARRLIERGRDRLGGCSHADVDVAGIVAWADGWLSGERDRPLHLRPGPGVPLG